MTARALRPRRHGPRGRTRPRPHPHAHPHPCSSSLHLASGDAAGTLRLLSYLPNHPESWKGQRLVAWWVGGAAARPAGAPAAGDTAPPLACSRLLRLGARRPASATASRFPTPTWPCLGLMRCLVR